MMQCAALGEGRRRAEQVVRTRGRVVARGVLDARRGRHERPKVDVLPLDGQVALAQGIQPRKLHTPCQCMLVTLLLIPKKKP